MHHPTRGQRRRHHCPQTDCCQVRRWGGRSRVVWVYCRRLASASLKHATVAGRACYRYAGQVASYRRASPLLEILADAAPVVNRGLRCKAGEEQVACGTAGAVRMQWMTGCRTECHISQRASPFVPAPLGCNIMVVAWAPPRCLGICCSMVHSAAVEPSASLKQRLRDNRHSRQCDAAKTWLLRTHIASKHRALLPTCVNGQTPVVTSWGGKVGQQASKYMQPSIVQQHRRRRVPASG